MADIHGVAARLSADMVGCPCEDAAYLTGAFIDLRGLKEEGMV